jgi:hypothetical protein
MMKTNRITVESSRPSPTHSLATTTTTTTQPSHSSFSLQELHEPTHEVVRTKFLRYSKKKLFGESPEFILAVRTIEKNINKAVLEEKKEISEVEEREFFQNQFKLHYNTFIVKNAPKEINLPSEIRTLLKDESDTHFTLKSFLLACENIEDLVKKPFHSFLGSPVSKSFKESVKVDEVDHSPEHKIARELSTSLRDYLNKHRTEMSKVPKGCLKKYKINKKAIYDNLFSLVEMLDKLIPDKDTSLNTFKMVINSARDSHLRYIGSREPDITKPLTLALNTAFIELSETIESAKRSSFKL